MDMAPIHIPFVWVPAADTAPRQTLDANPSASVSPVTVTGQFTCMVCRKDRVEKIFNLEGRKFRTCLDCYRKSSDELMGRGASA